MFEKVSQQAEELATRLPRRAFFRKVAQTALPVAAALSGLLVLPNNAGAKGRGHYNCCFAADGSWCAVPSSVRCPDSYPKRGACRDPLFPPIPLCYPTGS
jgi:hypothetical protein